MGIDIQNLIAPVQDALAPVGGTLSDAWQAVIGDRVTAWRLKNAAKLQLKINDELRGLNLKLNSTRIPERYAFSWFEEATKQDEPEIQELFARLLARAANDDEDALDRRHINLLSQFTPLDAKVFFALFGPLITMQRRARDVVPSAMHWREGFVIQRLEGKFGKKVGMSLEHLENIGVLKTDYKIKADGMSSLMRLMNYERSPTSFDFDRAVKIENEIVVTNLGFSLYQAIKTDESDNE